MSIKKKGKNMNKHEIYSKREKRFRGEVPDSYQYEIIPNELRVQVFYIWGKVFGEIYYNDFEELQASLLAWDAFSFFESTLREEYGLFTLGEGEGAIEIVRNFLLETEDTEKVIDVIEVSFRYIDQQIRVFHDEEIPGTFSVDIRSESYDCMHPDEAIDKLNNRFREHSVGYQYESGQIIRVDSQFIHSEAVRPTLKFLSDPMYKGANEEFLNAHQHYRKHRYKECLNDCLKAFESCIKGICKKRGWHYDVKNDTAKKLIQIVFDHELIPTYLQCHFSALKSTLESGLPTVRNREAGHGQGPEKIDVPEYLAAYALHLTASNILLLTKADEELK